jgi:hypothetical protein
MFLYIEMVGKNMYEFLKYFPKIVIIIVKMVVTCMLLCIF